MGDAGDAELAGGLIPSSGGSCGAELERGGPASGGRAAAEGPAAAAALLDRREILDYLDQAGEWSAATTPSSPSPPGLTKTLSRKGSLSSGPAAAAAAAAAPRQADGGAEASALSDQLGRVVAGLAATAQRHEATAVAGGSDAPAGAGGLVLDHPLRLAVVGAPLAGKTSVAQAVARAHGLKMLSPEALVAEAIAAAETWDAQQEQHQQQQLSETDQPAAEDSQPPATDTTAERASDSNPQEPKPEPQLPPQPPQPPAKVLLGHRAAQDLAAGRAVSDDLVVALIAAGIQEARAYVAPRPDSLLSAESSAASAKTRGNNSGATAAAAKPTSKASLAAAQQAAAAAGPPPFPGGPGRGFVIDGFPSTQPQAAALERALTGLDLGAEASLVAGASRLARPPADALPQLERPLTSGLDAVVVLECGDEGVAVGRALGRRVDPVTGAVYHLESNPPPSNVPGLTERLVGPSPPGAAPDAAHHQVAARLAAHAAEGPALVSWIARFGTLLRRLDAAAPPRDVSDSACAVAAGVLRAKAAAAAAAAAAEAARAARDGADRTREFAAAAREAAEAAARELVAVKRAELQAVAMLTGAKNADPAAAEVVKAQASVKCAEQLKVCFLLCGCGG